MKVTGPSRNQNSKARRPPQLNAAVVRQTRQGRGSCSHSLRLCFTAFCCSVYEMATLVSEESQPSLPFLNISTVSPSLVSCGSRYRSRSKPRRRLHASILQPITCKITVLQRWKSNASKTAMGGAMQLNFLSRCKYTIPGIRIALQRQVGS